MLNHLHLALNHLLLRVGGITNKEMNFLELEFLK